MLIVETIRKIRLAHYRDGKSIRRIARDFRLSKNTVKKILRSGVTELAYRREVQPRPKLGAFEEKLSQLLTNEQSLPRREQRTAQQMFEELQREGFAGGYDSVRRYVQQWKQREKNRLVKAFIPLSFAPGEAFFVAPADQPYIRLNFAALDEATIERGIATLGALLRAETAKEVRG